MSSFNLTVEQLEQLISKVVGEKLKHLPLCEKKQVLKDKLVTLKEITQIFKISKQTVYKWIKSNVLPPSLKVGGRVYFKKEEINDLITKENRENEK